LSSSGISKRFDTQGSPSISSSSDSNAVVTTTFEVNRIFPRAGVPQRQE
jgi:hypothetical protein